MVSPRSLCDAPAYEAKHPLEGTCNRVEWKVETELSHTPLFLPICRHSNALHNSLPLCDCNPSHAQLRASTAAWPHTLSPASTNLLSTCLAAFRLFNLDALFGSAADESPERRRSVIP
mmetsp:Transcript_13672/g.22369  ORF Transcript_13672/g.22369 Transcript_13672/m.22369 type:complete len:118 (-) Transcript_13672:78-431(-)